MCLILFSYNTHKKYKLILAANRDEFYDRPTEPANFWKNEPEILGGLDIQGKGTWMGVNRSGCFACLTNYRVPFGTQKPDAPSRGRLVSDFLKGKKTPEEYLMTIQDIGHKYNGFNLLVGDKEQIFYFSNKKTGIQKLVPGIYGLSNRFLNSSWPKVEKGKKFFKQVIDKEKIDTNSIFHIMQDHSYPPDEHLPDTGVGLEWERILAPVFISSPDYGTRSSSILMIGRNQKIRFIERTFAANNKNLCTILFDKEYILP